MIKIFKSRQRWGSETVFPIGSKFFDGNEEICADPDSEFEKN